MHVLLRRLLLRRTVLWRSWFDQSKIQATATCYQKSGGNSSRQTIGYTSLILQDGLDIFDIPLILKRLTVKELPDAKVNSRTQDIRKASEEEEQFRQQLSACSDLSSVFKLLEMRDEVVTAYSAAFVLQCLYQMQAKSENDLEPVVQKAVLNELCETVTKDISKLENITLTHLMKCVLKSSNLAPKFMSCLAEEIEKRLVDGVLSIEELCVLIELVASHARGSSTLVRNMFIHLGSRYRQLNASNLRAAFAVLRFKSADQGYLLPLWTKSLRKCWWLLNAEDVNTVAEMLAFENFYQAATLTSLSNWMFTNIHRVNATQLRSILGCFNHFVFSDARLLNSLHRYLKAHIASMDGTLIGMVMDHCLKKRQVNVPIFEIVATHVSKGLDKLSALDLFYILRPFGHLGYIPNDVSNVFHAIESALARRFAEFEPHMLTELLASFAFIDRLPLNFVSRIYSPHFFLSIRSIPDKHLRQKATNYLLQLQAAILLDGRKRLLRKASVESHKVQLDNRHLSMHLELARVMCLLLPARTYRELEIARSTPHLINFEIAVDDKQAPIAIHETSRLGVKRVAVVAVLVDHCLYKSSQLMGEHAMKMRHLRKLGYAVAEVRCDQFYGQSVNQKKELLRQLLSPHVNLASHLSPTDSLPSTILTAKDSQLTLTDNTKLL